jgi:Leucine-rich repeat (LRR) protein
MFEQKIQELHGDTDVSDVKELNLDGCDATSMEGLNDKFESLSSLSLANNKLSTLKSFPSLKTLKTLNLRGNELEGGLDYLAGCVQLKSLDLSNNKFSTVQQLEPLKSCAALEALTLKDCPITETETYKSDVFEMLPQLTTVDGDGREGTNGTATNGSHAAVNGTGDAADDEPEAGLEQLQRDDLEDDDEEYNPEGEEEEDELDEDDDDEEEEEEGEGDLEEEEGEGTGQSRGVKRKHEDEDPLANAEGDNASNGAQ